MMASDSSSGDSAIQRNEEAGIREIQLRNAGIVNLATRLPSDKAIILTNLYAAERKDRLAIWAISFFFGVIGADRFFLGQIVPGCLKLVTLGCCGVWWLIDLIIIDTVTMTRNKEIAYRIYSQLAD